LLELEQAILANIYLSFKYLHFR